MPWGEWYLWGRVGRKTPSECEMVSYVNETLLITGIERVTYAIEEEERSGVGAG